MCHLLIKIELPLAPLASEPRFVFIRANSWAINDSSVGEILNTPQDKASHTRPTQPTI